MYVHSLTSIKMIQINKEKVQFIMTETAYGVKRKTATIYYEG
jgi:hypothetical protein